jgi:hypothetical protein
MSSYILHLKAWLVAAVAILAIEAAVQAAYHPSVFDSTNFLQFSFGRDETPQRLFMYHKLSEFAHSEPTIVQSGDSSGFYGIDPREIMKYLPPSVSYLNLSCCANLGFNGYYNVFRFMAERNKALKYFVLHVTLTMPRYETWNNDGAALWGDANIKVFGDAIDREFVSPRRWLYPPSLAFRREISDRVFYLNGMFNAKDRPLLNNENYFEFLKLFKQTRGWMPENDVRAPILSGECSVDDFQFFDLRRMTWTSYTEEVLDAFADLARKSNKVLVVVFQPVPCGLGTGQGSAKARATLDRFKANHPEVEVPFPLITSWPASLFSVTAHIAHEHTQLLTQRLGPIMADIVKRHGY